MTSEPSPPARNPILALVSDLIFAAKINAHTRATGVESVIVRSAAEVARKLDERPHRLFLVDLDMAEEGLKAIADAASRSNRPFVLAFGSHVNEDLLQSAREAGADEVMPRSRFHTQLPDLLARH